MSGPALLVGTAGHVDHGKTALLRALTGIDCDRLPEEKRRGITLDLGFAHLEREGVEIGFVDVPGHERFLDNALAGLGGIRLLLLVVAADEGVRPQTREHLEIADLLGIPRALVVLTKLDAAGDELADLVELEVAELLAPTRFRGAEVLRTSSVTGRGIDGLAARLLDCARAAAPAESAAAPARLPIDRAFLLPGRGLVVTGTLAAGAVAAGDELEQLPAGRRARVRAVHVHGRARDAAAAGSRTALQVAGLELGEVERGDELVAPGRFLSSRRLLARLRWLPEAPALEGRSELRVHLFAAERVAVARPLAPERIEPGAEGLVELRLAQPLVAARGDRLIVRRLSPAATLGGGEVLDPRFRRPRGPALVAALAALGGGDDDALGFWIDQAAEAGAAAGELARRLGRAPAEVERRLAALAAAGRLLAGPDGSGGRLYFSPARLAALEKRARALLDDYFGRDRLAAGMPRAEAARRLLPRRAAALADFHLGWLAERRVLELDGGEIRLPGRRPELTGAESGLAATILEVYEQAGLEAPSPAEVARTLAAKPEIVDGLVRYLVGRKRLLRLPAGLVLSVAAVDRMVATLRAAGVERFTVADFKERFGLTRKWAIPLLEHLDSTGVTRRVGDQRHLRPPRIEAGQNEA